MVRAQDFAARRHDYLIVGGGTAGLALAARLSERPEITVGVVEAGPAVFDEPAINIPGYFGQAINSKYDWQFETTAQPSMGGNKVPWPRGKVLGGTSALNLMGWNRGNREDYDAWEQLGNRGWGWDALLPFFKRSETFYLPYFSHLEQNRSYYQEEVHGTTGPAHTCHIQEYSQSHQFWHPTLNHLGVGTSSDSFAGSNVGAWNMICTVEPATQSRSYSANAYYLPVADRPNLYLLTEATVTGVLVDRNDDGEEWATKGVRLLCNGGEMSVLASREVILSAGTVQSPQLLELSGIGDRDVLEAAGISAKVNNPNVGENLQDHMMTATVFEVQPFLTTRDDIWRDPALREAADREYDVHKTGPWTILPASVAYCPLLLLMSPNQLADIRLRAKLTAKETGQQRDQILAHLSCEDVRRGQIEYLFELGNWSPFFKAEPDKKYGTMLQMLHYPFSKGSVHLPHKKRGSHVTVNDKPVIDPRYYLGPGDIDFDTMKAAQQFVDQICATQPLANIICSRVFPPIPESPVDGVGGAADADEYDQFVRNYTTTNWHPIGTCAMGGSEGEKAGVVDDRLRVYGVRGLRVVDASIMPLHISAHIQATVYAIAEKAASMILEDADRGST